MLRTLLSDTISELNSFEQFVSSLVSDVSHTSIKQMDTLTVFDFLGFICYVKNMTPTIRKCSITSSYTTLTINHQHLNIKTLLFRIFETN